VYKIDRGRKHKVSRIIFHGNYKVPASELLDQVAVKQSHLWTYGAISQKLLKQSKGNIEAVCHDHGYEDVKVTPQAVDREPQVVAVFEIQEGPQTLVDDTEVTGNQHIPYEQLTAPKGYELRAGVPFSPRKLANDRNRIEATYLNRGYLNVDVKTTIDHLLSDSHRVYVTYAVTEHQLVRVSQVVFLGEAVILQRPATVHDQTSPKS